MMVLAGFYLYLSPKLPAVESIRDIPLETPLRIYTSDHKLIGEFGERRRYPIKFEDIPKDFVNALIAAEDDDFYSHNGVSLKGLLRAATQLVITGRKGSGGSTLTMQLTRHVFLSLKRTFSRKFNEILLALRIEKELSKEEILELYVNLMFLGKRAYGIEAAAGVYYGKSIGELTLAQHAMLVGVFKGPTTLNPINSPERALDRRNYVLKRMFKLDYIDEDRYQEALAQPVTATHHGYKKEIDAPYVAEMARKKAIDLFGPQAYSGGYQIYTTVQSARQESARQAIASGLLTYDRRHGYRGPEQQLKIESAPELATAGDSLGPAGDFPLRDYSSWLENLAAIPEYGGLLPAVVAQVNEKSLTVLKKDGAYETIEWERGLATARPYLSENAMGPSPKTASDVAQTGDVVRIVKIGEAWHFTQIPDAQAALVALAPNNGAILALVGGFDFEHSNFNRATQAQRQPGSNFKPFIYAAALENGLTAATIMNDAPIVIADKQLESTWRPENSSRRFYGPTRLRNALTKSRNLVSIRVLERIGVGNALASLEKFGFSAQELPRDLSLALGTHAVTPLDVVSGYAIFANGGYRVEPYLVQRIESFDGEIVYEALPKTVCRECDDASPKPGQIAPPLAAPPEEMAGANPRNEQDEYAIDGDIFELSKRTKAVLGLLEPRDYPRAPKVITDQIAFIMDSMLKDVIRKGTGYKAWQKFRRSDIAGKTGTTNGPMDAWFTGYHPNCVTTTWVGFDQNLPLGRGEYGGSAALPIWIDFMQEVLAEEEVFGRIQPPGVVSVRIDPATGQRAEIGNPDAVFEIFRDEYVPELGDISGANPWESEESINEELF